MPAGCGSPEGPFNCPHEWVLQNFFDFSTIESELSGFDACFFCLGVSSAGMTEESYTRITYDLTMAAGQTPAKLNPGMPLIYVSGQGYRQQRARAYHVGAR
jgi:hypothetical protein